MIHARTGLLLATLTGLFVVVGVMLGGVAGMVIALALAFAMNLFAYLNLVAYLDSGAMVLRMYGVREVDKRTAPGLGGIVELLADRAGLRTLASADGPPGPEPALPASGRRKPALHTPSIQEKKRGGRERPPKEPWRSVRGSELCASLCKAPAPALRIVTFRGDRLPASILRKMRASSGESASNQGNGWLTARPAPARYPQTVKISDTFMPASGRKWPPPAAAMRWHFLG